MKIRTRFVSNSSSSSFVIALSSIPKSVSDIDWLNLDNLTKTDFSKNEIYNTVLRDINTTMPVQFDSIVECVLSGYLGRVDSRLNNKMTKMSEKEFEDFLEESDKIRKKAATKIAKKFVAKNNDKFFYKLNYGDERSMFESVLEHSDLFKNIPNLEVSLH